jgi:hypothetical protein
MESQLMKVPDDHLIPMQYPYEHSEIYIRECFPRYFELLWEDLFVKKKRFVLITGTPGIGKSIFYIYVMQRMKERLPGDVVLVLASFSKISELKSCVILKPGKSPVKLKAGKNLPIFEKAVYLLDGIPRIVFDESIHVKTVIFASPNHQFLKEHSKNALMSNLYMPLWTEPEILEAVELLELELDEKLVRDLFYRFGGSVRYILTEDQDFRDEGMDSQIKAITSINSYAILEKCLQLKLEDKDVIHRVFYFVPRADSPRKYEMNLGSIYIKYAVEENLENADKQERLNLFRWLNSHGHSKSTAGWLFEGYCHDFLSSGFEGSAKSLIDDATYLDLKILEGYQRVATIKSIEEIYRNMYSVPESSNLPAVDSFYIDQQKRMIYFVPDDRISCSRHCF